jgi:hypothetical protein
MENWAATQALPDIPRIYTALAEWLACMMCIMEMNPRFRGWKFRVNAAVVLVIQAAFLEVTDGLDGIFWILCMAFAIGLMYMFIYLACDVSLLDTGYSCVRAFVMAEFMASLEWQLHCYIYYKKDCPFMWVEYLLLIGIYGGVCIVIWLLSRYYIADVDKMDITVRELVLSAIIGLSVFMMSNVGFMSIDTPFSGGYAFDIFNVRTLIDLGGLAILYAYHTQRLSLRAQNELERMEMILHNQYHQYQQSRETLDLINYKYHDLKHHIIALRAEDNKDKQKEYLDRMEEEIQSYDAQKVTGNSVLDTLLTSKSMTCIKNDILLTTVVDGALLNFMDVMDICSIFGNALDNAIEYEKKIEDKEKRMIDLTVFSQKSFLLIRFENYCEGELQFEQNLPVTTKKHTEFHGYGLKSLRHTVHKYDGEVDISVEDSWFHLKILIPMELKSEFQ